MEYGQTSWASWFHQQLGTVLNELVTSEEPVDASKFLTTTTLKEELRINVEELGDTCTAWIKLLGSLRQVDHLPIDSLLFAGRMQSTLSQSTVHGCMRKKQLKVTQLPNPLSLEVNGCASIEEAMERFLQPRVVSGYTWKDDCETVETNDTAASDTFKTTRILETPPLWMLHLDRRNSSSHETIDVPTRLAIPLDESSDSFVLVGAILHVSDDDSEEGGHAVALVLTDDTWFAVDDDTTIRLEVEQAMQALRGSYLDCLEGFCYGMLVLYQRCDDAIEALANAAIRDLQPYRIDWSRPESMVDRRIRVQWSKKKWYSGTIVDYDSETEEHTVEYDDGDVKDYVLRKKKIEWL